MIRDLAAQRAELDRLRGLLRLAGESISAWLKLADTDPRAVARPKGQP